MSLRDIRARLRLAGFATVAAFTLLGARLAWLQVGPNQALAASAVGNALRQSRVVPPRGRVVDRDGEVLADARPTVDLVVRPADVDDPDALGDSLGSVLDDAARERLAEALASRGLERHREWVVARDLDATDQAWVAARRHLWASVSLQASQIRTYPSGSDAAHLVGYISEVGRDDLLRLEHDRYRAGDQVGRRGLERSTEGHLRGEPGLTARIVDNLGRPAQGAGPWRDALVEARDAAERTAIPGADVVLTLDADVQRAAVEALDGRRGAAVMLDVHDGALIAYASSPAYDPAELVKGVPRPRWQALVADPARPLLDRTVRGVYPPASTFKLVTAAAALEVGISPAMTVSCTGGHRVGRRRFRCWKRGGHGVVDLRTALMQSCDVWFYVAGLQVGPDGLADMGRRMGLGPATGFGLNDERGGQLPSEAFVRERFGLPWTDGDTASTAIGQGIDLATPLQLAVMTAVVANRGSRVTPWVVDRVVHPDGSTASLGGALPPVDAGIDPQILEAVAAGMTAVVMDDNGTARRSRIEGLPYAGKTGTAQTVSARLKAERPGPETEDHALFVAFAPLDDPQVAVAVVVEHVGGGSTHAAPVARRMLEAWAIDRGILPPHEEAQ